MDWYKNLDINTRIELKSMFPQICGVGWSEISFILSLRDRIIVLHDKLRLQGLI